MGKTLDGTYRDNVTRNIGTLSDSLSRGDAAYGWDWHDPSWYGRWNIPNPFSQANNVGVDITVDKCRLSDGWELYIRRLLTTDGVDNPTNIGEEVLIGQKYFALYNIRTCVLRVFIFFNREDYQLIDRLITEAFVSSGAESNPLKSHGLFNNIGSIAETLEEDGSLKENKLIGYCAPIRSGWVVLDYPLAYDPAFHTTFGYGIPRFLNIAIYAWNTAEIKLTGKLTISTPGVPVSESSMFSKISSTLGPVINMGTTARDAKNAGNKLKEIGEAMTKGGGDGSLLVALGSSIVSGQWWIAGAFAGTQLIRGILSLGDTSGGVKMSLYQGTLVLEGTLVDEGYQTSISLLVSDGMKADSSDVPYFFKKFPGLQLGLFSLKYRPVVVAQFLRGVTTIESGSCSYRLTVGVDPITRDMVNVNPGVQGLKILEINRQVIYRKLYTTRDKKGKIVLGKGIVLEADPVTQADPSSGEYANIFPAEFEDATMGGTQVFIMHGYASERPIDEYLSKKDLVLVRLNFRFGSEDGNTFEVITTYTPQVYWNEERTHDPIQPPIPE